MTDGASSAPCSSSAPCWRWLRTRAYAARGADQHSPGQHQRRAGDPGDQRRQHAGADQQRGGPVAGAVPADAAQLGGVGAEHDVRRAGAESEAGAVRRRRAP